MELDLDRVRLFGDPDSEAGRAELSALFDEFRSLARSALAELAAAAQTSDHDRVRRVAHEQKGACGMVGATTLAGLFARLEQAASDASTLSALLADAATALDALEQDIDTLVGRSSSS